MAVYLIRAKMNNVFPTSLNGCPVVQSLPLCQPFQDNFGLFVPQTPYFSDVPVDNPYFAYIQKMRELRISTPVSTANPLIFNPDSNMTRAETMTWLVRAFFP
jgi:hypothetical protein